MDTWATMLTAVGGVFAVAAVGAAARRLGWLSAEADDTLFRLVVRLLLPALILDVILGNERLRAAESVLLPPLVGAGTVALGFGAGALVAWSLGARLGIGDAPARRTFAFSTGLYNYGYVPIPLCEALFDDRGTLGVLFVHNLGVEIAVWTLGIVLLTGSLGRGWWRQLVNGPSVAIVVGLGLNATGAAAWIPAFASRALGMLGACAIPTALLLIGATVADRARGARLHEGKGVMGAACALRLGALPVAFLALAWALPGPIELRRVVVLEAAMPAAVFPIVLARYYEGSVATAMRVVLATTLLGLLTMPLWLMAGLSLLR